MDVARRDRHDAGVLGERRIWAAFAASWVVVPAMAALVGVRLHWGYWVRPPHPDRTLESVVEVERYTSFASGKAFGSGASAVRDAAARENWAQGEFPLGRLAAAMLRRGLLPASDDGAAISLLDDVSAAFDRQGLLVSGEPGYPQATELRGVVAEAVDGDGQSLVVAALVGGEASNDHHPYYYARLRRTPSGLVIESFHRYWYDVAGIEGFGHAGFAWLGVLATALFWIACGPTVLTAMLLRDVWRRRRSLRIVA